jgi:hypothetical protein
LVDGEGNLDPAKVESAFAPDDVYRWMKDRCSGTDAQWPLDAQNLEVPESILIELFLRATPGSALRKWMGESAATLLKAAWEQEPRGGAAFVGPLLEFVAAARPDETRGFLREAVVARRAFPEDTVRSNRDFDWLRAAAMQSDPADVEYWEHWMRDPRYGIEAFEALLPFPEPAFRALQQLIASAPADEQGPLAAEAARRLISRHREFAPEWAAILAFHSEQETSDVFREALTGKVQEDDPFAGQLFDEPNQPVAQAA